MVSIILLPSNILATKKFSHIEIFGTVVITVECALNFILAT